MSKAIRFHQTGGPEVLKYEEVAVGEPGAGQVRLRHTAIGVNFLDTYHRSGLYPMPLPSGLGSEGAGVVEAVGPGVTTLKEGDRVAYTGNPVGSYAQTRLFPADRLVKTPAGVTDAQAASMMLKGMTVQYLIKRTFPVQAGQTVLWHAAAGGVGLIATQWLNALGVQVIGTVGSAEKAVLAKKAGCAHVINYSTENFTQRVKEITGGKGVPVVYDSIGNDTFIQSLDCLAPLGMMVSYGSASGPVPPFSLNELASRGSLFLTRPSLFNYAAQRSDLEAMAADLFRMVESGKVKIEINQRYALKDAQQAHRDLESRKTTGSTILLP